MTVDQKLRLDNDEGESNEIVEIDQHFKKETDPLLPLAPMPEPGLRRNVTEPTSSSSQSRRKSVRAFIGASSSSIRQSYTFDASQLNIDRDSFSTTSSEFLPIRIIEQDLPVVRFQESFWADLIHFRPGSIPQSIIIAIVTASVCGAGAYVYYIVMSFLLEFLWHTLPQKFVVGVWDESLYALWIPLICFPFAIALGLTVMFVGEPGDLAYTVQLVHSEALVPLDHVAPMVLASLFSIVGGGSVGPEAPLVAICAALGGALSTCVFHQTNKNVMRKHTLMGMASALAAFFGCPLGGSIFALEICSRFGIEYFEHLIEAILCGLVCMGLYRSLTGEMVAPIWENDAPTLEFASPKLIMDGALIGLAGAVMAYIFTQFHWAVVAILDRLNLLDNRLAIVRALIGCCVICAIGMFVPHVMFWGEAEFQTLYSNSPAETLEHVFPTSGLIGFEMDTWWKCFIVGLLKLVSISFTVAGGYRGGFIFPLFTAGCAFAQSLVMLAPSYFHPTITCLSFAAGICVPITKTSVASTLILTALSGEANALSPILAASLASLLATSYMPFIKTQSSREDEVHEAVKGVKFKEEELFASSNRGRRKSQLGLRNRRYSVTVRYSSAKQLPKPEVEEDEDDRLGNCEPSLQHHTQRGYIV